MNINREIITIDRINLSKLIKTRVFELHNLHLQITKPFVVLVLYILVL